MGNTYKTIKSCQALESDVNGNPGSVIYYLYGIREVTWPLSALIYSSAKWV